MRLCLGVAAALLVGSASVVVHAQYVEGRASIMLAGGYSAVRADYPAPATQSFSGPSLSITPMLALLYETPRTNNNLDYAVTLTAPLEGRPVTYMNRLDYQGRYELDELTTMMLLVSVSASPVNSLIVSQDPAQTPLEASPPGAYYLFNASAREALTRYLTTRVTLIQQTSLVFGRPIDTQATLPSTFGISNGLSVNRLFDKSSVGLAAEVGVDRFTAQRGGLDGTTILVPAHTQLLNTLGVVWSRSLREGMSVTAGVGAVQALNPEVPAQQRVQPTASASFNYGFGLAAAMVGYSHQAAVNLAAGSASFADQVQARASLPAGATGLVVEATTGFSHVTPLTYDGALTAPLNVFLADLGLAYFPPRVPTISLGLRGQIQRQVATGAAAPIPDQAFLGSFSRYAVSLSVTYSYPRAAAARTRPNLGGFGGAQVEPPPEVGAGEQLGGGSYENGALGAPGPNDD